MNKLNYYANHPRLRLRKVLFFDKLIHEINKLHYTLSKTEDTKNKSLNQFDYYDCIYIHIPKTAGSSINNTLFGNLGSGHIDAKWFKNRYHQKRLESFFIFTIVRNPWSRLYSAYNYLKLGGMNEEDKYFCKTVINQFSSFEEFVENWVSEENIYKYWHFIPQADYILGDDGRLEVDFIGRYENLEKDFEFIAEKVVGKRRTRLAQNNIINGDKKKYQKYYTSKMIDIVSRVYREDIELLDYSFKD